MLLSLVLQAHAQKQKGQQAVSAAAAQKAAADALKVLDLRVSLVVPFFLSVFPVRMVLPIVLLLGVG